MKTIRLPILVAFIVLLSTLPLLGQSTSKNDIPPHGKAVVYFYRPGAAFSTYTAVIFDRQGPLGLILPSSYFSSYVDPGVTKFWLVGIDSAYLSMEISEGQAYYIRCNIANVTSSKFKVTFEIVDDSKKAQKEIGNCQLLEY